MITKEKKNQIFFKKSSNTMLYLTGRVNGEAVDIWSNRFGEKLKLLKLRISSSDAKHMHWATFLGFSHFLESPTSFYPPNLMKIWGMKRCSTTTTLYLLYSMSKWIAELVVNYDESKTESFHEEVFEGKGPTEERWGWGSGTWILVVSQRANTYFTWIDFYTCQCFYFFR